MLFLLALPIFLAVAAVHRYVALYAPSNILIRHVRTSPPCWRTATTLAVLSGVLVLAMRGVEIWLRAGAPGLVNLAALILAWDAIKVGALAICVGVRAARCGRRHRSGTGCSSSPRITGLAK
jgi:hypothetical protein